MSKGQEIAKRILQNQLCKGQLSHAYLFNSPSPVVSQQAALFLAQAVNCEAESKPCGVCLSCRQIEAGVHADVRQVGPEGASIKLHQVKAVLAEAVLTPNVGPYRVFIIEGAELLTREAANALLLILEEPPGFDLFILTAAGPVLPTIESRCQLLRFPSTGDTRADARQEESRIQAEQLLQEISQTPLSERTKLVDKLEKEEVDLVGILAELLLLYRDFAVWQVTRDPRLVKDVARVELFYPAVSQRQPDLMAATQAILDVQRRLQNHVNRRLALEYLIYSL
ncbi:MAG TPA: DNA polymerase III subunit [Firmicutes bacterium]|nr:DNA polymerase III subunit [Bacillota bacterium]